MFLNDMFYEKEVIIHKNEVIVINTKWISKTNLLFINTKSIFMKTDSNQEDKTKRYDLIFMETKSTFKL
jgi:hypothetical protein